MKSAAQHLAAVLVTAALWTSPPSPAAAAPPTFGGEKTSWHGFDRYDFLMDEADLSLKPYKAPPDEGNAVRTTVKGQLRCVVVAPKEAAPGNPWSWRGYYFDHEPQVEIELLKRGFHVGFIWCDAGKPWDAWYAFLADKHGLSKKPAFIGMSRGGRNAYTWATAHPDQVSCVYADNPAVSPEALALLGGLARNDVPLLHVCGSLDPILGNHTLVLESAYQQLGGRISVMIKDGAAHHPHSLRDPKPIADFIEQSLRPAGGQPPAFVGKAFTKTSFYGIESDYREIPSEKTFAACRGPWFAPSYDRYEFRIDGIRMPVSVIVPKAAAPGKPWVFRADFVTRDAAVDLALLGQGFHVVTGPVPTDSDGPVLQQWNAVYKHLTDHGLSKAPVLEGAGGAAGEAYAWAIENPDKVSCVYAENPILRCHMTKAQPLDRLDVLAKAGVPLFHVCGGRDPWLDTQTRVLEKRYKELGGQVTVVVQEGAGHFPTAPKDPKPVVEFIACRQTAQVGEPKPLPAAALPPTPAAQGIPKPAEATDQPYAPQPILQGGTVLTLYPPDSPYLKKERIREAEKYNLSKDVPGRISSIVNIHNPSIEVHLVDRSLNTGSAVILVAGGGHRTLNVGSEAADFVPFFYNYGVNTVILRNRLRSDGYDPKTHAVNDAQQAIRLVRAHAREWRIDPNRIGIMGFSAGAELAAPAALFFDEFDGKNKEAGDPLAGVSSRPDFVGIIYPGPTPFARGATPAIPRNVPPSFIACAGSGDGDHAVWANEYFAAMLKVGVPNLEMHIYGNGHHPGSGSTGGLTDRLGTPFGTWHHRFIDWFRDLGFLQPPGVETKAAKDVAAYAKRAAGRPGGGRQTPPGDKN